MKTLLLTEEHIKHLLSMDEAMDAVESAFKEKGLGHVQMPAKLYLFYKQHSGDLRAMPSYLEDLDISAVKVVNVHPENRVRYNLPTVMAVIVLIDPKNGAPLAIMGGTSITDMRTGAAGGIAAKYLARKSSKVVGFVGAGAQSKTQLLALLSLYGELEEVRVWSRTEKTRDQFVTEMGPVCGGSTEIVSVGNAKDAAEDVDIIVTTTPSRKPIVSANWISLGTHINCIGADAPGKEELEPSILTKAKIVVDDWDQASHSGEINVPLTKGIITKKDIWSEIGEIVAGLKPGRTASDEITVFTSTGLAIQDAVTAELAYKKALAKGIGSFIEIT
ncbi:MAG: alanine dehydrogenase [Candidatus Bathyarchaeota archaeon]|nr:alanine dehydrogenase [Candidatus Bathyarchaeota archaeon]MDH5733127.1 alanine dehydrogenase [Candidatus Bathyarchaeota archaeon]